MTNAEKNEKINDLIELVNELAEFADEQGADFGLWIEEWDNRGLEHLSDLFLSIYGKKKT